jgi:hypothetical protein
MDEVQSTELRDLLLHRLSADRAEQLEDQLLLDTDLARRLEAEENDLIDDCARGLLQPEDATLIERHILTTPDAERKLNFALALTQHKDGERASPAQFLDHVASLLRVPVVAIGLGTCLALLIIGLFSARRQSELLQARTNRPPLTESSPGKAQTAGGAGSEQNAGAAFAIVLLQNTVRGVMKPAFAIPNGVTQVRIECEVPASDSSTLFELVVRDETDKHIAGSYRLSPREASGVRYVEGALSVADLKTGKYTAMVFPGGNRAAGVVSYSFAIQLARH